MNVVLTVGNEMMGDDAAGPLLAHKIAETPLAGWELVDGGSAPENELYKVRELAPQVVVVVDAAEMGLTPGDVRILDENAVADQFIMTTHNMPLVYVIRLLKEFVPQVIFAGIQPDVVAFGLSVSAPVQQAVQAVYRQLALGRYDWPAL
jgi:hydrogenase 3 maturation protease